MNPARPVVRVVEGERAPELNEAASALPPVLEELDKTEAAVEQEERGRQRGGRGGARDAERERVEEPRGRQRERQGGGEEGRAQGEPRGHERRRVKVGHEGVEQRLARHRRVRGREVLPVRERRGERRVKAQVVPRAPARAEAARPLSITTPRTHAAVHTRALRATPHY